MVSSGKALLSEPSAEVLQEAVEKVDETLAEEPVTVEVEKTLASVDGEEQQSLQTNGDPPSGREASSSGAVGEVSEEALAHAVELFEKGSKAIEDEDFVDAVDCLSRALEIRVAHYGELAPECAVSYYKYGCALLFKAQEETDPLVDVPKKDPRVTEKAKTLTSVEDGGSLKASINDANQDASHIEDTEEEREVCSDKDEEDEEDDKEGSDGEGSVEADDSDLDMAWKMLELGRAIVEKSPEDSMEKVNILAALGEVSAEREDVETSLSDYLRAISILERLVEPDNRRIVELNFRICLVLEVGSRIEEAIPYCEKAISLCKSRLQRVREDPSSLIGLAENNVNSAPESDKSGSKNSMDAGSDPSVFMENETGVLSGILSELERKLEDMQQTGLNPNTVMSEIMEMIASKAKSTKAVAPCSGVEVRPLSLNSSQIGGGGGFDSPTISAASTNGGVTHLGVVGRGIKRAVVTPSSAEPSPKKSLSDISAEKDESSVSEATDQDAAENPM